MKNIKKILCLLLCTSLLFLTGCASFSAPEENDSGSINTIASTSVAICEILDELGYENVIGVPETSGTIPERYASAKTIGAPMNPDLEIIKSISPDLVLSPQTLEGSLAEQYKTAGINSAFLDLSSVEGMYKAINSLGELLGCKDEAERLNNEYKEYISNYNSEITDKPDVLLLMCFPDGFYLVATENSYVGNLVKLAGGNNVYGSDYKGDENGFVSINPEDIVQKNPDIILTFAHYSEQAAFDYMKKEFETNTTWQYFEAVKNGNIGYLPSSLFGMSATLSWQDSIEYLKPLLHGDTQ